MVVKKMLDWLWKFEMSLVSILFTFLMYVYFWDAVSNGSLSPVYATSALVGATMLAISILIYESMRLIRDYFWRYSERGK